MLASKVEDMLDTVVRQIAFYSFERRLHVERRNGELTAEQNLRFSWMSEQPRASAPRSSGQDYKAYWAYIPHFIHSPFYVYAYAFGDRLVNSLYGVYRTRARALSRNISRCSRRAARRCIGNCWRLSASTPGIRLSGKSACG